MYKEIRTSFAIRVCICAEGYGYNRLRKGGEMFLAARFLIPAASRSGIRGFMRTTMRTGDA